ncbi:MAG TPA: OmpA family protein [Chryseolinea sp.]|nr:OmpA family protein [Chryseolinea sp.]
MKQRLVASVVFSSLVSILFLTIAGSLNTANAQGGSDGKSMAKVSGHQLENTVISTLLSAKVGGTTGTMINKQMDRQASELKSVLQDAKVMRFEEGILITIDSRLLFEEDSYGLQSSKGMLKDLARILAKYAYTNAIIEGHTDNVGEDIYNQSLSEQRAHEIETYLVRKGVKDVRMKTKGYGERQPIASNDSESGRQMNRRIEIALYANEELRHTTTPEDATYSALKK